MTDAAFIATGWIGTALTVAVYAISVHRRTQHAITVSKGRAR